MPDAMADFERAIAADKDYPDIYCHRGQLYILQNKLGDALTDLRKAVSLDGGSVLARIQLGMALHRNQQQSEAQRIFQEAEASLTQPPPPTHTHTHTHTHNTLSQLSYASSRSFLLCVCVCFYLDEHRPPSLIRPMCSTTTESFSWRRESSSSQGASLTARSKRLQALRSPTST